MKLKKGTITLIADMICGDNHSGVFPYRSSSYLTQFFRVVDTDYVHHGETRKRWVQEKLDELNEKGDIKDPELPSVEIVKVIEQLVDPSEFFNNDEVNRVKAIAKLNELLNTEGLKVSTDRNTGLAHLETKRGNFISTASEKDKVEKVVTFSPNVFKIPDKEVNPNLVSVMMPFSSDFDGVYESIKSACSDPELNLICVRADDIWDESEVIQDIFNIIFESSIVVADLTGKKPNVFYEVGIAHTLGKVVIPISQSLGDVPFDIRHHRALKYLDNGEGREQLQKKLKARLLTLKKRISQNSV